MNISKSVFGLLIGLTLYSCVTNKAKTSTRLHGMWMLDKWETFDSLTNTWTDDKTRVGANGYILYDGQGHMGVHLTPKGYKDFDTNKNIDSLNRDDLIAFVKFYKSNQVYFADYTYTENTVIHILRSSAEPKNWGKELIRDVEFRQDTLILTPKALNPGQKQSIRLRWIKLK